MTDTKTNKATSQTEDTDEATPDETDEPATESTEEPTMSVEDAVEAATAESDETDRFYDTGVFLPGPPEASPDGQWLAFLKPDEHGALELWIAPTDGGEARELPVPFILVEDVNPETGRQLRGPQWSPDGTRIAVTGLRPEGDHTAVWLVPTGVGGATAPVAEADVAESASDDEAEPPTEETPDSADHGDAEEVIADAPVADVPEEMPDPLPKMDDDTAMEPDAEDGAEPEADVASAQAGTASSAAESEAEEPRARMLVDHPGSDRSPRWSPDGEIIAMTSTIDGRDVIALVPVADEDTSAMELLTWSLTNDHEPVWSRDGKFLAFLRQRQEGFEHNDIYCYALETGQLMNLTESKDSAIRHSLEWVPGRNLIAYVTRENEWYSISVVNADNKAGWTVTRESGDKTSPRFARDEARLMYIRTEGFTTVVCERSLHASSAVALDPGEGVARYPRWLDGKRVAYGFSAPQRPFGFLVQENLADADRSPVPVPGTISLAGQTLQHPQPFEFETGPEEMFSGMLYRTAGVAGKSPAIVYMPDGPLETRRGEFQMSEQALASTALTVLAPVIHGASGFGAPVEDDLRDFADSELEVSDLAEAGKALGKEENIDADKLAIVGHGYGGALALLTAGGRPGVYKAVVAIDPVTDWSVELGNCDVAWRNWVTDRFGMPLTDADAYAIRTPATFSAVIDVPVILVRTDNAPAHRRLQLDLMMQDFDENGIAYELYEAGEENLNGTLREVSKRLARAFLDGADSAEVVDDIRADELA